VHRRINGSTTLEFEVRIDASTKRPQKYDRAGLPGIDPRGGSELQGQTSIEAFCSAIDFVFPLVCARTQPVRAADRFLVVSIVEQHLGAGEVNGRVRGRRGCNHEQEAEAGGEDGQQAANTLGSGHDRHF
jgi:hypothetical protein